MNRNDFITYIQHPDKLTAESSANLSGLIQDFPYFQTAHLLYTKNLFNQNSIHYNHQLKIAAAYSGDRKVLYNLIHSRNKSVLIEEKRKDKASEKTVEMPVEVVSESKQHETSVSEPGLEKEIISEVISSYIEIEVDKEIVNLERENKELLEEYTSEVAQPKIDLNRKYSFQDWLKITEKSTSEDQKREIVEQKTAQDLIDKFIVEEPRISKPKAEFFSPVNLARKGVVDDDNVVSETLAKIYETQGHYLKAIRAYESLNLKYPEKKLFFAARIKELKKKLIS